MNRTTMTKAISLFLMMAMVMGFAFVAPGMAVYAEGNTVPQQNPPAPVATQTQLPKPGNVRWDGNGLAGWDKVADSQGEYYLELFKDGGSVSTSGLQGHFSNRNQFSFAEAIALNGDGTYRFAIKAIGYGAFSDSDFEYSDDYIYKTPSVQLKPPTNLRWESTPHGYKGVWDAVPGTDFYKVRLEIDGEDIGKSEGVYSGKTEFLLDGWWTNGQGSGEYRFTVRAISADIESIASSEPATSPVLDYTAALEQIKEQIEDILAKAETDPVGAADDLKQLSNADLAAAMQNDSSVLNDIKKIEDKLKAATGITVNNSVRSDKISGGVSIVGAAFNAVNPVVTLNIDDLDPAKDQDIVVDSSQYSNWVKLNIELDGAKSGVLDVPVQITMPIPTGISPTRLVILHVRNDGSMETIHPAINGNYATFTVTSFSPFAFANAINGYTSPGTQTSTSGGGGSSRSDDKGATYTAPTKVKVDATVNGNRITIKGQNALGLTRILHGDKELVRGTDYTVRNVDGGVEIRILLDPGTYDLKVEFLAAYCNVTVTIDRDSTAAASTSENGSAADNVNGNPNTGR